MTDDQESRSPEIKAPRRNIRIVKKSASKEAAREVSTIGFPYQDLEAAISVARAILQAGGVALTRDQLAGVMNQSAGSGAFVTKVATARMFGLILANNGKYELTDTGFEILDTDERRQKAAKATAFLNVPLFRRTYEEFRGRQLPPRPVGLEMAFVKFGVSPKQKTNARLAFDKSAAQASFFPNGQQDRLVEPILSPPQPSQRSPNTLDELEPGEDIPAVAPKKESETSKHHPFIQGLLDTLPAPQTNWAVEGRAKWLQAAANIFDLIYQGSGAIEIKARNEEPGQ